MQRRMEMMLHIFKGRQYGSLICWIRSLVKVMPVIHIFKLIHTTAHNTVFSHRFISSIALQVIKLTYATFFKARICGENMSLKY